MSDTRDLAEAIGKAMVGQAPENVYSAPEESADFDGEYGIHYDGPLNLETLASNIISEVKARALEEFADFQERSTRKEAHAMDDTDWAELAMYTSALRAYAAVLRRG